MFSYVKVFKTLSLFILFGPLVLMTATPTFAGKGPQQTLITQFVKVTSRPKPNVIEPSLQPIMNPAPNHISTLTDTQQTKRKTPDSKVQIKTSKKRTSSLHKKSHSSSTKPITETVKFIKGTDQHLDMYTQLIEKAENDIVIASWKLNFIPPALFRSLMKAKRNGVYISFIVNEIVRPETLDYFYDSDDDLSSEEGNPQFSVYLTRSHAKFIVVDKKQLLLGSFNALSGDADENTEDSSLLIRGTINQTWPYYMRIRDTYNDLDEKASDAFGGIAAISSYKYGKRPQLDRTLRNGTRIHLLKTLKDHNDFFEQAIPNNGAVTLYSPFSTRDNTLHRLKQLEQYVPAETPVILKVLPRYESGLKRLLGLVPGLKQHSQVDTADSHQKILVIGSEIICIGSFNWLSATYKHGTSYENLELSIVLQGPTAANIISRYYSPSL